MLEYLPLYVLATIAMALFCTGYMLGPGLYNIENIRKCEGRQDDYLFLFDVVERKLNRTHDVFNPNFILKTEFDHSYSINVDICKFMDGGCKLYLVLSDADAIHFFEEYAKENLKQFLKMAGVEEPYEFPLSAGTWKTDNFIFNYEELPKTGLYGYYEAHATIMDENNTVVGCVDMTAEFQTASDKEDEKETSFGV